MSVCMLVFGTTTCMFVFAFLYLCLYRFVYMYICMYVHVDIHTYPPI